MRETDWILAQTKPSGESRAAVNIKRQGHEFYLPVYYDRKLKLRRPLFAGYIFVFIKGLHFHWLHSTFGVSKVIMFADQPAVVPLEVVTNLKARENEHGVISLPGKVELEPGDRVSLLGGPLANQTAIYEGQAPRERAWILLEHCVQRVNVERRLLQRLVA